MIKLMSTVSWTGSRKASYCITINLSYEIALNLWINYEIICTICTLPVGNTTSVVNSTLDDALIISSLFNFTK